MNSLDDIARAINKVKHVLICGHVMPDGDCLGSALALALALKQLGKVVTVAGSDPVPEIYGFLPGVQNYHAGKPPGGDYDALIVLDCPVVSRLGKGYRDILTNDLTVINIDHHVSRKSFGTYRYVDPTAAAVGEIVYELLRLLQVDISIEMAACLYTAIITDTGSFQYESTTAKTHRLVAELLETGLSAFRINMLLYEEKARVSQILLGAVLDTITFSNCGRVAWIRVTRQLLHDVGARDEHTEGMVNFTRSVKGVEVGLLFHELADGKVKVSFRSKQMVNVNHLANLFGGGGHIRAAGCEIAGNIDAIVKDVVAEAQQAVMNAAVS